MKENKVEVKIMEETDRQERETIRKNKVNFFFSAAQTVPIT